MTDEKKNQAQLNADVLAARAQLAATFDAIEDKLNLPRRFKRGAARTNEQLRTLAKDNPVLFAGLALSTVVVIGGTVWGIAKLFRD